MRHSPALLALALAACTLEPQTVSIDNTADESLEGNTPRSFADVGGTLVVGDNLDAAFPEGAGVQAFIAFDLRDLPGPTKLTTGATLRANGVHIEGTPFEDLGSLLVDRVAFDELSEDTWELANETPTGPVVLAAFDEDEFTADVGKQVQDAFVDDERYVQFRLYFSQAADGDGAADLVRFHLGDAGVNEPGIFSLDVGVE